jgi:mono/diheme cytochrome c family protein
MKAWILVLLSVVMFSVSGRAYAAGQENMIAQGKALYNKNCSKCHGPKGVGTDKGPPFLNKIYEPSHHGDMSFLMASLNGVRAHHWNFGNMPPIKGAGMAEIGKIIKYVRAIQQEAGIY